MERALAVRKLAYKLVVLLTVVVCMACGGAGDDPSPTDRTMPTPAIDLSATATAPSLASTPPAGLNPTTPAEPTSEVRPDIREFCEGLKAAYFSDLPRETYGDMVIWTETFLEDLQDLEKPEELEGMFTVLHEQYRFRLDFVRGQDPNEPVDSDFLEGLEETAEAKALEESYREEERAVDPDVLGALDDC